MNVRKGIASADKLARSLKVLLFVMGTAGIPEYSCKKSNRIYSYRQKIAMLVLRQEESESYERFCRKLGSYRSAEEVLGLEYVPHPTTLSKFANSVDEDHLHRVILCFSAAVANEDLVTALDGTGFSGSSASRHFVKRLAQMKNGVTYRNDCVRGFVKASFLGDTGTKLILSADASSERIHDLPLGKKTVERLSSSGLRISFMAADKGYDSEDFHVFVKEQIGAVALIPPRDMAEDMKGNGIRRTRGTNRCRMKHTLAEPALKKIYNKRSIIECVNSICKRLFGDTVLSRNRRSMTVEVLCRTIAHNLERIEKLSLRGVFT